MTERADLATTMARRSGQATGEGRFWLRSPLFMVLACTILLGSGGAAPLAASEYPAQFTAMGYLLFRCSNLNLIHGLPLERSQLIRLYEIARLVDALAPPPPLAFTEPTDLRPIVETFLRLATALRRRRPIPESFRRELIEIRERQSRLIRQGLRYDRTRPPLSCARCHWMPGAPRLVLPWIDQVALHPGIRKEKALSHMLAPFGLVSFLVVAWHADEIDALLTAPQRAAMASFTCCLLPPREFANPIRIGQADLGDWEIPALEKIRHASPWTLPFLKAAVQHFLARREKALRPGVTRQDLEALHERTERLINQIRTLSDVDFELQKGSLARQFLAHASDPLTERMKRIRQAMFLLIPGASEIYADRLAAFPPSP